MMKSITRLCLGALHLSEIREVLAWRVLGASNKRAPSRTYIIVCAVILETDAKSLVKTFPSDYRLELIR